MRLTIAIAAAFLAFGATAADKWDMPMAYAASNFHSETGAEFAQCVTTGTAGELEIATHPGGSLFKGNEIYRAVRTGQTQIGERLMSAHQNDNVLYGVDSIPFLATSFEDSERLWVAAKPILSEVMADEGLHLLYAVPWPPQGLYFKKEVNSVSDMEGVKFRSYSTATARIAELAGMIPVQIEAAEISQAFATGVADSMISSGSTGYDRKVWESLTHFYEVDAWLPRNYVFVNMKSWEGLSDDIKNVVNGCAALAEYAGNARSWHYTQFTLSELAKNGMSVGKASDQMTNELRGFGEIMTAEWLEQDGPVGQDIVDSFLASQ